MIITKEFLEKTGACKGGLNRFKKEAPIGFDISPLWGTDEEATRTWLALLSCFSEYIGWAVALGVIPQMRPCVRLKLHNAQLEHANLSHMNLARAILDNANLRHARLAGVNFSNASFRDTDLSGAVLRESCFHRASCVNANFQHAHLSSADLSYSDFRGADLSETNLMGANLKGCKLEDANLTDAISSKKTQWSPDFDWKAAGVVLLEHITC